MKTGICHARGLQDNAPEKFTGKSVSIHTANLIVTENMAGVSCNTKSSIINGHPQRNLTPLPSRI
jgi:hypothetical protein